MVENNMMRVMSIINIKLSLERLVNSDELVFWIFVLWWDILMMWKILKICRIVNGFFIVLGKISVI